MISRRKFLSGLTAGAALSCLLSPFRLVKKLFPRDDARWIQRRLDALKSGETLVLEGQDFYLKRPLYLDGDISLVIRNCSVIADKAPLLHAQRCRELELRDSSFFTKEDLAFEFDAKLGLNKDDFA